MIFYSSLWEKGSDLKGFLADFLGKSFYWSQSENGPHLRRLREFQQAMLGKQFVKEIPVGGISMTHAPHISLEFALSNIAIPTLLRQSHKLLIHSHSVTMGEQVKIEKLILDLGIIRLELTTSTISRSYSTARLYIFLALSRNRTN